MTPKQFLIMDAARKHYLDAMGIEVWQPRAASSPPAIKEASPATESALAEPATVASVDVSGMDWASLESTVAGCKLCPLHATRTQTVFGVGSHSARWMVIGEAPGADEDRQGEPFVGRAGQLLTEMLRAAGFKREEVYIANILKCRPPSNRDPRPGEVKVCSSYLLRQIELLQPKLILAVGRIAAQRLLNTDETLGRLRGKVYRYGGLSVPLVVTYHPAYLLRSPLQKRKSWADLQFALRVADGEIT